MNYIIVPSIIRATTSEEVETAERMGMEIDIEYGEKPIRMNTNSIVSWWETDGITIVYTNDGFSNRIPLPLVEFEEILKNPKTI